MFKTKVESCHASSNSQVTLLQPLPLYLIPAGPAGRLDSVGNLHYPRRCSLRLFQELLRALLHKWHSVCFYQVSRAVEENRTLCQCQVWETSSGCRRGAVLRRICEIIPELGCRYEIRLLICQSYYMG